MGQIIVVEGKSDTRRLFETLGNVVTFETSGLGLDDIKINKLKKLNEEHDLIVFTDPDGPGEIIRKRLIKEIDGLYHAYLPNDKALSKKLGKIGIEHASKEDIEMALANLYVRGDNKYNYTIEDLVEMGIYSNKVLRTKFCNELNIAYGNNKKVVKQLNYFDISPEKISKALSKILD